MLVVVTWPRRLREERHVRATASYDEVVAQGDPGSCPSFTRALRTRGLRPHCEACAGATSAAIACSVASAEVARSCGCRHPAAAPE